MKLLLQLVLLALATTPAQSENHMFLACGRGSDGCNGVPLKVAAEYEDHEVRCCRDEAKEGWTNYNKNGITCSNWAESKLIDLNGNANTCIHAATYAEAQQICKLNDSYVCTKEQILKGCTRKSGCGHYLDHLWTSSPASPADVAAFQARQAQAATIAGVCTGPTGRVWGDPHFETFDKLKYDCQGQGEFVIAKSEGSDPLAIHGRFVRRFADKPKPTVTGSVAIKILDDVPTVHVTVPDSKINGQCPFSFTYGDDETPVPDNDVVKFFMDNYNGAVQAFSSGKTVFFTVESTGTRVQVTAAGSNRCVLNTDVCLSPEYHGNIVGLLGNPTETTSDDWTNRDGSITSVPEVPDYCATTEFRSMTRAEKKACKAPVLAAGHDWCMANWCVGNAADSLYTDATHAMYNQCTDTSPFEPTDPSPEVVEACEAIGNPEGCETDAQAEVDDGGDPNTFAEQLQEDEKISNIVDKLNDPTEFEDALDGFNGPVPEVANANAITLDLGDIEGFEPEEPSNFGGGANSPPPPAPVPVPAVRADVPSGSRGDPHFKTWQGEHFEYHGQCDLVLAKDENFADGLGLDVQIRTKLVRFWSYIMRAAIRIGDDIIEVEGSHDEPEYWFNFRHNVEVETVGGFPLTIIKIKLKNYKHRFEIDLSSKYPGQKIVIGLFNEFVKVEFVNASEEAFGNVVGLLGDFKTGQTFGRDGVTELHDFIELGNEWQVMPVDHMMFHDVSDPQFPKHCNLPEDPRGDRRRRLEESSISIEEAEATCAKQLKDPLDVKDCVYDILATQDMDMAGAF